MLNIDVKSFKKETKRSEFEADHFREICLKKIELEDNPETFQDWYNNKFKEFIIDKGYEELFEEELAEPLCLGGPVIEVEPEKVSVETLEQTMGNIHEVVSRVADSLQAEGIIEPKETKPGLVFDHLVVKDPTVSAALDDGAHTIKVEEGLVTTTLFDNSQIISRFPDMGRIQDIIRTTDGWDVEMILLYNDFIINTLYVNGVATNKIFIVDYNGHFINNLPKIFLINGGYVDESEVIHLSDNLNLINYLKGVKITQDSDQIITPAQRKIAKYIVNYGTPLVHDKFRNKFEDICINKVVPFIETQILPQYPDASFAIDTFKDSTHWGLSCTPNIPYRFGETGGACKSTIYIHADGMDKEGHLLVTPTFG